MQPQYQLLNDSNVSRSSSPNMERIATCRQKSWPASGTFSKPFKDPYAAPKTDEKVSGENPMKGLFQMQPQYPTPGTTQMFPEALPKNVGNDGDVQGRNLGQQATFRSHLVILMHHRRRSTLKTKPTI